MSLDTHFLLNDREVRTAAAPAMLVLDYLRQRARQTGTKEGCREGDCGACAVLVGELDGARVVYKPVTSCLMPVADLHGRHLVTIEGLNLPDLTPVQRAIADEGATQCGFCTPGIVVSLTGLLMQEGIEIDLTSVKKALSGHLCRCTGYRSLKSCGEVLRRTVGAETGVEVLVERGMLPDYFRHVPERLRELASDDQGDDLGASSLGRPGLPEFFLAGGTDLYVQRGEELPEARVEVLGRRPEMRGIERRDGHYRVGALTTFEEFAADDGIRSSLPEIGDAMHWVASWQIRNQATLGGNVVNASPIGDMTILLLALDAVLVLERGNRRREVALRSFYHGYKKLDLKRGEILTEILIPIPAEGTLVSFEKVSKRRCLDIASVNSAISILAEAGTVVEVGLSVGGVAPVPLTLERTAAGLLGREISKDSVARALSTAQREISPISDVRGSATYKRLLVRQLLIAHFTRLFPDVLRPEDFLDETH
jgi:xanthine dehydrogenase small subunit